MDPVPPGMVRVGTILLPLITRHLFVSYFYGIVKQNDVMSDYISLGNGVKQGRILSSTLFPLRLDPLSEELRSCEAL